MRNVIEKFIYGCYNISIQSDNFEFGEVWDMRKNTFYKIVSIIMLIITILAVVCGVAVAHGQFVDLSLSNTVRGFCIAIATISGGFSLFFYKKSK